MAEKGSTAVRVVINDVKSGNSFQRELPADRQSALVGRKIGEKFEGGLVGLAGYSLQITGGSDEAGFPMRKDVPGQKRVKAIIGGGAGVRRPPHGAKLKKLVSGNTMGPSIRQVNAKIAEYGPQPLEQLGFVAKAKEAKAETKVAEK